MVLFMTGIEAFTLLLNNKLQSQYIGNRREEDIFKMRRNM